MLERFLEILAEGGIHSYEDLERRLSVSRPLLEALLEELARLGYLKAVGSTCAGHCAGCATGGCSPIGPGRVWALTERDARAVSQGTGRAAGRA